MTILRKTLMIAGLGFGLVGAAHALSINPDAGGVDPTLTVGSLDWSPGNALVTPYIDDTGAQHGDVTNPQVGDIFQTYAHARLASFNDLVGNPYGGINLNGPTATTNYEWTYVAGFQETVAAVSGAPGAGSATFHTSAGGNNFFEIYYDPTPDGVNVNGSGFHDGTMILSGTILPFDAVTLLGQTSFTATTDNQGQPLIQLLDQFGGDNYSGEQSISGTGGGHLAIAINTYDASFFPAGIPSIFTLVFDTQLNLPYNQTDPSSCFWDGTAVIDGVGPNNAGGTCTTNSVGATNGLDGPNEVLMSDSANNFPVPEPMSLALMGIGLGALGIGARRRQKA